MLTCTLCELSKELSDFPKDHRSSSGYRPRCKSCTNILNKKYRDDNKESVKKSRKSYYQKNITKMRKEKIKYGKTHRVEKSLYDKEYRAKNKEKIKLYKKHWEIANKNDPLLKIKRNLRRRVSHALSGNRKMDRTFNLIGCTPNFFKQHIESQFTSGMSWNNYGQWHIDHIIPCFKFDLSLESEQRKCFHYTNQRPLWAKDNLSRPRNN